jgi:hypothetical protein
MLRLMALSLLIMLLIHGPIEAGEGASESRLDEVQRRGSQVMPFSLEQTTHIFTKTDKGGVQQVVAKENADPEKIHGDDMPGLATLKQAMAMIRHTFDDVGGLENAQGLHDVTPRIKMVPPPLAPPTGGGEAASATRSAGAPAAPARRVRRVPRRLPAGWVAPYRDLRPALLHFSGPLH